MGGAALHVQGERDSGEARLAPSWRGADLFGTEPDPVGQVARLSLELERRCAFTSKVLYVAIDS